MEDGEVKREQTILDEVSEIGSRASGHQKD
jgi:hypothetical protein